MGKNEVLEVIISSLMKQRSELTYELKNLNHNENSFNDRKMTLEMAISNIDMQIGNRVMDLEIQK